MRARRRGHGMRVLLHKRMLEGYADGYREGYVLGYNNGREMGRIDALNELRVQTRADIIERMNAAVCADLGLLVNGGRRN